MAIEAYAALSRRDWLSRMGTGFGTLGLASVLAQSGLLGSNSAQAAAATNPLAPRSPHFAPRAKRVIFLFMNGGPSHVDTFDPKPMLNKGKGNGNYFFFIHPISAHGVLWEFVSMTTRDAATRGCYDYSSTEANMVSPDLG
jgi:hypothetical protein